MSTMKGGMERLTLFWEAFPMRTEALPRLAGKPGLYAIMYESEIIYIGKAGKGNAVLREAKNRENKWIRCLQERKGVSESMMKPTPYEYICDHCRIYVGTILGDQRLDLLDNAEQLLIYDRTPICNDKHKKKYDGIRPFVVVNNGSRPQELPARVLPHNDGH